MVKLSLAPFRERIDRRGLPLTACPLALWGPAGLLFAGARQGPDGEQSEQESPCGSGHSCGRGREDGAGAFLVGSGGKRVPVGPKVFAEEQPGQENIKMNAISMQLAHARSTGERALWRKGPLVDGP